MGRFYQISVDTIPSSAGTATWSSQVNGKDDPGALNVQFDLFEYCYGIPNNDAGNATITIEGVLLQDLQQAQTFVGRQITVQGGMSAGYPLANPTQRGTILAGQIFQSFGNWIGTDMTLDFVVVPSVFTMGSPGNFVLNWQPGTTFQDAITQAISSAYSQVASVPAVAFQLSGNYAPQPNGHLTRYSTLRNLGAAVNSMTKAASPGGTGVTIAFLNTSNTILVFDGPSQNSNLIQIQFTDLIGQPTWVDVDRMQFVTVMRADIQVNTKIKMPQGLQNAPGIVPTTAASFPSSLKYKATFQGNFVVKSVRQIGNFRDPNGTSWVSVIECVPF